MTRQESIRFRAATPLGAVTEVLGSAGQTILVAGLTLGAASLAGLAIPLDSIRGMRRAANTTRLAPEPLVSLATCQPCGGAFST